MLLVLAVNGGLFAGAILHSISQMASFDRALDVYQNFWT
jgi:hypothetical protein